MHVYILKYLKFRTSSTLLINPFCNKNGREIFNISAACDGDVWDGSHNLVVKLDRDFRAILAAFRTVSYKNYQKLIKIIYFNVI